ncbi:MAG: winged helix-turn-helix domain-containing protein [Pseudomonadota bacterium]
MKPIQNLDIQIADSLLEKGLKQVIQQLDGFTVASEGAAADIVITDGKADFTGPVIRLPIDKPLRVGRVLQDIASGAAVESLSGEPERIMIGEMIFLPRDKKILPGAGQADIALTDLETRLLLYFTDHPGQNHSKDVLLKAVWEYQTGVTTHTVETHIYRLRQKLPMFERYLVTTDTGYMLK